MSDTVTSLTAAGGNSHMARSARAQLQWRDRFGRWIEMGRGVKFKFNRPDGSTVSARGVFVGSTDDPNVGQLFVSKDANGLPDGFYNINSANAQEILASLDASYLQERGITIGQHADGTSVGDRLDEAIPTQDGLGYSVAPTGWTANGKSYQNSTQWTTDDGEFIVRPATFPIRRRTGKNFMLYRKDENTQRETPVGQGFDNWAGVLDEVNSQDEKNTSATPNNGEVAPAVPAELTSAADVVKAYDTDGSLSAMVENNAPSKDVLDALSNNPDWKRDNDDYETRDSVDSPQQLQKDKWAEHEKKIQLIKELDSTLPAEEMPEVENPQGGDGSSNSTYDLSVGDVAPEGYIVPTEGNLEEHASSETESMPDLMASYVDSHRDAFAGGGKRLSVASNDDGSFSFDVVDQVSDHNEAQTLASERNATEIYDLANSKVISTAQGRPRNDGANSDINPNAVESVGNGLESDNAVPSSDGGTDQAENQPSAGGQEGDGRPADTGGEQQPTGDTGNPSTDAGAQQPAPDTSGDSQPSSAPAGEGSGDTSGQRPEAVTPAPEQPYDSGLDENGLPEDRESLQRMVNRMEAKASRMQDDPAVEAIESQLDAIYKKLARLDSSDAPETPAPEPEKAPEPTKLAPNSVTAKSLPDGAVTSESIAPDSVTAQDISNDQVTQDTVEPSLPETEESLAPDLGVQADILRERFKRAADTPSASPLIEEPLDAPETLDTAALSQRIKDAEAKVKQTRTRMENFYKTYGDTKLPTYARDKPDEMRLKRDLAAARTNLALARADMDKHLNADDAEAVAARADKWRNAGAPKRAEMPEGLAVGDSVEWGDGNRGTVRRAIVDRNGKTRVTVSRDADQANNQLAGGNVVNILAEDLRKVEDPAIPDETVEAPQTVEETPSLPPTPEPVEIPAEEPTAPAVADIVGEPEASAPEYVGEAAQPATSSRTSRLTTIAAGKELTPEQQSRIDELINNDETLNGQVTDMLQELREAPNRPNTITRPRENNPANFTTSSPELINVDPGKIADPDRIMGDLKLNHEGYQMLANGDIVVESRNENGNTYDLVVRRTASERFFPYIRETDNETGVSRALRVGDETHSYKALTTKMNRAKDDLRKDGISKRFGRKRGIEYLPANGDFDSVPDPIRDFIDHTNIARTPDDHTNKMAAMIANIAARGDSETVLRNVAAENNLSPEFVDRIVDAVMSKAQNDQLAQIAKTEAAAERESEIARRSWIPFEGDSPLQVGDWVDWTDYREFIDVNKETQRDNPNYMRVYRGQVRTLRAETNDGNGDYVYSDSTYVVFPEMNTEAGMKPSKQRQRISSQLRKVESENAPASDPFLAKKAEKQLPQSREEIVRDFTDRPSVTTGTTINVLPRQIVEPEVDIEGTQYLNEESPVAVPTSAVEAARAFAAREAVAKDVREIVPGDMIAILPGDDNSLRPATVISSDNVEGQQNITLAYYDKDANLTQVEKNMAGALRLPVRSLSETPAVEGPEGVSPIRSVGDRVSVDDIPGQVGTITDVSAPDRSGEVTYTVRAESNGAEYPRKDRYVSSVQADSENGAPKIQPVGQAEGRYGEPATGKQRDYITDLLNRKQVSVASRNQITRALDSAEFTKGSASQIITELKNHKNLPASSLNPQAGGDAAANVAQMIATDLKRDPNAVTSGQRVQDAVDAASQERVLSEYTAPTNDRNYDGYSVAEIKLSEVEDSFTPVEGATLRDLQIGDLIPKGVGSDKYYWQVIEQRGDKHTLRMISDGSTNGMIADSSTSAVPTDLLRPTPEFADSDYFRQGPGIGEMPMAPNQPATVNNYQAIAQGMLDSYNSGYEAKVLPKKGAMNQGASIIRTQNGDEYFVKRVPADDGQAESEVAASIVAHAIGLTDTTVISPDSGTVVSTNVKGDLAGTLSDWDGDEFSFHASDLLNEADTHPNVRKIGLLDYIIANSDRHAENWMIVDADTPSGKDAVPIDHGNSSWLSGPAEYNEDAVELTLAINPFVGPALGDATPFGEGPGLYTQSELIQIRERIMSQRAAFISASPDNGLTYYKAALANITRLIERL